MSREKRRKWAIHLSPKEDSFLALNFMSDKKYVYVAGKMTATGDIGPSEAHIQFLSNLARGIEFSGEVIVSGYHVFSPFIDYSIFLLLRPGLYISPKMIRANSMAWLEKCDQIILVPGDAWRDSQGTADELKRAGELHLPVYYTLDEMLKAGTGCNPRGFNPGG